MPLMTLAVIARIHWQAAAAVAQARAVLPQARGRPSASSPADARPPASPHGLAELAMTTTTAPAPVAAAAVRRAARAPVLRLLQQPAALAR
jgi:hypothetical protein